MRKIEAPMDRPDFLDEVTAASYVAMRQLPDGRWLGVLRLLFHWTLHVDIDAWGYRDRYCYAERQDAMRALRDWDGTGDPEGWHRHPRTGRRRDKDGNEWVAP